MNETVIGQLVVRLKGDASHLEKVAKDNNKRLHKWADEIHAATRAAAASFVAMGAGIALAVRGMINEADKMGKMAQSLGIPIEQLTAMKYAAEQANVPFEMLSASLTKFNQSLGQIASGEITPAATALNALGVSATTSSGELKSSSDLMSEVADKFARMQDGANKASIAIALFGEAGVKLTPLLNRGATGIKDLTDEAERLGVVITADAAKAAAEFNAALQKIGASGQRIAMAFTERLLPDLNLMADAFARTTEDMKPFTLALDGVAYAVKVVGTMFAVAAGNITALIGGLQILYNFSRDFIALGWDKAIEAATARVNELKESLGGVANVIGSMWGAEGDQDRFGFAGRMAEMGVEIPKALAPAMQSVADLNAEFAATRESARMLLTELLESPTEDVATKIAAITQAARDGVIGFNEYRAAISRVTAESEAQWDSLVAASTGAMTSIFSENKAAGIASALINTYQAITKALASAPPPLSYALAAATAAQGFAQVKAIRATKREYGGPVAAGQPYIVGEKRPELFVPSQSGTIVPSVAGRDAPIGNATLTVRGFNAKTFFSGDSMREIAEQMLAYQRNGGKIVFA